MTSKSLLAQIAIVSTVALGVQGRSAIAQSTSDASARVMSKLNALREEAGFPGMTAAVYRSDMPPISVALGKANAETGEAMRAVSRMLAGSIGKTFVAAVALQLVESGKLKLDQGIGAWLSSEPWYTRLANAETIALKHLLRHESGIREHVLDSEFQKAVREAPDRAWTPKELVGFALDKPALFPAGSGWSYADTNYILVGMIIEKATGKTLYHLIRERILIPNRLERTIQSDRAVIPDLAVGYSRNGGPFGINGATMSDGRLNVNPQFEWAGGGFASTSLDLAQWAHALYSGNILKPESLAAALEGVPARTGRGDKYGLGVQLRQSEWGITYGHGGWFPGYRSEVEYFPDQKAAIAVQFNTDDSTTLKRSPRAYIAEIARIVFGAPKAIECGTDKW